MIGAKPFDIPKREVWEAFKRVKANQGAAGVDGQSIQDFEDRLGDNLYKLWNRLSSGSYMPPPVRRVDIPKASRRNAAVGDSDGCGPCRAGGGPPIPGAVAGTCVPCGLLWISSRAIGDRCDPDGASAMLALRLGRSISTSKASSTASIMSCCSGPCASTPTAPGCCSTSSAG